MPNKLWKSFIASFLTFWLIFFPISPSLISFQSVSASDDPWQDYENYTVIDHNTVWSGQITRADIPKPVVVVNGAVLTIEKGTHIELGSLTVYDGRIVALGTEQEKIVFTRQEQELSGVSAEDLARYDPKCFMTDGGMIEFSDWVETDIEESSFFRYVEFNGMGTYIQYDSDNCPPMAMNDSYRGIFHTAYAASQTTYNPALKFQSGRLRMENSSFQNGAYADIEANMSFSDEWDSYDALQIVNSNFEGNAQNTALISHFGYAGAQDYSRRVLLKNNWYGDSFGPREMPDYLLGGEKVIGDYALEGIRTKNLIADPLIVMPGITGSAQVLGQWKLDPILHTYADLMASLKANGYEENINLFSFPYQWRNTNTTSALDLQAKIENVLQKTKISKVDVAAHSMGGLVARAYIEEIAGTHYDNTIDQLITLGTPQRGSPEAYLKWEAGEGFFRLDGILAKHHFEQEAEEAGYDDNLKGYINDKIVSVRELLPDQNYLFDVSTNQMREYPNNYPQNNFLEDLNSLNNVQKLDAIRFTNIVGKSDTTNTIAKIRVVDSTVNGQWEHGMPENFYDTNTNQGLEYSYGDETVPLTSAQGIVSDKTIEIASAHGDLPTKAQCEVFRELTGKSECAYDEDIYIPNILLFNVFSPIDIQVISPSGKKVGKNFEGGVYDEIAGAYYTGYDTQNEFITIPNPEDGEYKILTQGTGSGDYRIEAVNITEGANPGDEAQESLATAIGTAVMGVTEEKKIELLANDTVISKEDKDILAPTISITSPKNQTYLNNEQVPVTYTVSDDISPIDKIIREVKLDNAVFDQASIDLSLQTLGNHTLSVHVADEAENEATQSTNFTNTVTFASLNINISHYFSLGLIKKQEEVKHIRAFLKYFEKMQELIRRLEQTPSFPSRIKERLLKYFHQELNQQKEKFNQYLSKKTYKGMISAQAKDRIVEAVEMLLK
jgi:Lecithin:cholesterol acyltransferase